MKWFKVDDGWPDAESPGKPSDISGFITNIRHYSRGSEEFHLSDLAKPEPKPHCPLLTECYEALSSRSSTVCRPELRWSLPVSHLLNKRWAVI